MLTYIVQYSVSWDSLLVHNTNIPIRKSWDNVYGKWQYKVDIEMAVWEEQ